MSNQITVDETTHPGIIVASGCRRHYIDASDIQELGSELWKLVEGKSKPQLIFSLYGVTFLASTVLVKLITLNKKCKAAGGQLTMCDIHPDVMEIFAIPRLDQLFRFAPDLATAVQSFTASVPA